MLRWGRASETASRPAQLQHSAAPLVAMGAVALRYYESEHAVATSPRAWALSVARSVGDATATSRRGGDWTS